MKFKTEDLIELLESEDESDGLVFIKTERIGESRWNERCRLIFSFEDKIYGADYENGLTEMQETYPFENEGDEVEAYEMEVATKTITVYKRIKQS